MKKIKTQSAISITKDAKDENLINFNQEIEIFDQNKIQVLNTFTTIETYIAHLIRNEFLGKYDKLNPEKFDNFFSKIIYTNWFNFNEKRKLALEIITKEIKSNKEKERIEKILRKVMSYRNALTHGKFTTNGFNSYLEYYEGRPVTKELNDDFWEKCQSYMTEGFELLRNHLISKNIIIS